MRGHHYRLAYGLAALLACGLCFSAEQGPGAGLVLTSPAYPDQGSMDVRFTCRGSEHSPPFAWSGAPTGTRSFALVIEDSDGFFGLSPFVHWVVYNLLAGTTTLAEDASKFLPAGALQGQSDFDHSGYGGPCPPFGVHHYVATLFALDTSLPDLRQPTQEQLDGAMRGHVLASTRLTGVYVIRPVAILYAGLLAGLLGLVTLIMVFRHLRRRGR